VRRAAEVRTARKRKRNVSRRRECKEKGKKKGNLEVRLKVIVGIGHLRETGVDFLHFLGKEALGVGLNVLPQLVQILAAHINVIQNNLPARRQK